MADQRYKIYEQLGAGGNGAVFRAYDSQLKRWVAIKRLLSLAEAAGNQETAVELRREADTLASLRNANIVTIFDVGTDDEGLFMVMELLEGPDLADTIATAPLGLDDFKQLAEQSLEALLAAHQLRILHRDIKPENIKVERLPGGRLQAKIIDFGLARSGLGARKQTEDQSGSVMGSIYYMAPEQLSREPVDVRTDIYALGCVLYEALAARKAFDGKTVNEVIDKHLDHDVVPLGQLCPHLPHWLTYWVMRLMACKPDDRPQSAQQAIEEFRAWEKLPPAPNMMPWMPQGYGYGQMPGYTAQVPVYGAPQSYHPNPATGTIPLHTTGYYVPVQSGTGNVQPAIPATQEPVLYAQPVVENVPVAKPAGPAPGKSQPQKPGAPAGSAKKPGTPGTKPGGTKAGLPPAAGSGKNKKLIFIGAGVAVVLILGVFLMKRGGDSTAKPGTPTPSSAQGPGEANEKLFPMDRPLPIVDHVRVAHFLAKVGTRTPEGKGTDASNSVVGFWDDLAARGKNTLLKSHGLPSGANCPRRVQWKEPSGVVKGDRYALRFSQPGQPAAMNLQFGDKLSDQFPFGSAIPGHRAGATLGFVFQADPAVIPCRIMTLSGKDGKAAIIVKVNAEKEVQAEFYNGNQRKTVTVKGSNALIPQMAGIIWDGESSELTVRCRDASGSVLTATDKLGSPGLPLHSLQIGRVADGSGKTVAEQDQFHGFLAECVLYAAALKNDQVAILSKDLCDQYLQKQKPKPLDERYTNRQPLGGDRKKWKLTASNNGGETGRAVDGDTGSAWSTKTAQRKGMWFQIDLGSPQNVGGLVLDVANATGDFPRKYKVESSLDGKAWAGVAPEAAGRQPITEILFGSPVNTRFLKVTLTADTEPNHWQIFELMVVQ